MALPPLNLSAGGGGPATASGGLTSGYDNSGWVVNFGSGSVESSRADASDLSKYLPFVLAGAGLLIAWRLTRKR